MLIIITNDELRKFPIDAYEDTVQIAEAPYKFNLLAQNMQNYLCCGTVTGDTEQLVYSDIKYEGVDDIPSGFEQRVFPYDRYGKYLTYDEINRFLMIENGELQKTRADIDYLAIMAGVELDV